MVGFIDDIITRLEFVYLLNHLSITVLNMDLVIKVPGGSIPHHIRYISTPIVDLSKSHVAHGAGMYFFILVSITHYDHFFIFVY